MLYRKVPKNGDKLSVLGYGCMRLPVKMQSINEKLAEKQILYAMDRGINYFDTAAPYHNGKSEPFLGKVLARNNCRDKVKIATKLPHWQARSKFEWYNSRHAFKDKAAKLMYLFQNGGIVTDKPTLASMCVQCEKCLDKCPQDLPIPDLLNDVQTDMEGILTKPTVWLGKRLMKVRRH